MMPTYVVHMFDTAGVERTLVYTHRENNFRWELVGNSLIQFSVVNNPIKGEMCAWT